MGNSSSKKSDAAGGKRLSKMGDELELPSGDNEQTQNTVTSVRSIKSSNGATTSQSQPQSPAANGTSSEADQLPKEPILIRRESANDVNSPTSPLPNPSTSLSSPSLNTASALTPGADRLKNIDLDDMISRLLDAGYSGKVTKNVCLKNAEINALCHAAKEIFLSQPSLIELTPPVKIVGDVHGQYTDLIRMFELCGFPPQANYLFLGDYVDRGKQSLETILLLLCYKVKFPENFFLLRGNHECANVTRGKSISRPITSLISSIRLL